MGVAIVGSEAIFSGVLTRGQLRWNYRAVFPDIYLPKDLEPTLALRAEAAWLWSHRRGVITGRAAAALHGALWVDDNTPVEILWYNSNPPAGILSRRDRIPPGEITRIHGIFVTTPARTALDLGRRLPRGKAVAHLDALARATNVQAADILDLTNRYKGTKGVRRCREAVDLMDAGAQSPQETKLRLILIDNGFPRPRTQIPVADDDGYVFAYLDMGWPDLKIAVEYDGEHHRTDDAQYRWDAKRLRKIMAKGWIHIRVIKGDSPHEIAAWVKRAFELRESEGMAVQVPA
jgi:very-short-patch-repair endonuclease